MKCTSTGNTCALYGTCFDCRRMDGRTNERTDDDDGDDDAEERSSQKSSKVHWSCVDMVLSLRRCSVVVVSS